MQNKQKKLICVDNVIFILCILLLNFLSESYMLYYGY